METVHVVNAYAGFWKRFLAYIIDAVILYVVLIILSSLTSGDSRNSITVLMIVINLLYFIGFESSRHQATPGKMALGIKVTDIHGARIDIWRATGRYFAKFISGIILCIGYIMAGFTKKKQALHDIIANTLVVNSK